MDKTIANGLEGIVVAETRTSLVDGAAGRLVIAGRDVEQLAGAVSFEVLCARLWGRSEPVDLGPARARAFEILPRLRGALGRADGMEALRGAVGQLASEDLGADPDAFLVGAVGTFAAAWTRLRARAPPIQPDP